MHEVYVGCTTVHATVANGSVWFSKSSSAPRSFTRTPSEFLASRYCNDIQEMRIIALADNAGLIRDAYTVGAARGFRVMLTSPLLVHTNADRKDPCATINRSIALTNALFSVSPSSGGWHEMQAQEHLIYAATAQLAAGADPATLVPGLSSHPLWSRLKFINPCDDPSLAAIIAIIRDPRWYISAENPTKLRKLYNFMGFNPLRGDLASAERKELAIQVWRTSGKVAPGISKSPRGFLWRNYYKLASNGSHIKAEIQTAGLFLRFLRSVWLDIIASNCLHIAEPLFVPEYFFGWSFPNDSFAAEVAEAYKRYSLEQIKSAI